MQLEGIWKRCSEVGEPEVIMGRISGIQGEKYRWVGREEKLWARRVWRDHSSGNVSKLFRETESCTVIAH